MFIALSNRPRAYAWGDRGGIARFLGTEPGGGPEAELWFGTHPGSPAATPRTFPASTADHRTLTDWVAAEPELLLGDPTATELPILLKVLAAASPLSLQVHPTAEQARGGYTEENARRVPIDDPARNYKDPNPKPEIIVAVSETFDALCGFRPADEVAQFVTAVAELAEPAQQAAVAPLLRILHDPHRIEDAVRWLLGGGADVRACVSTLSHMAATPASIRSAAAETFATVAELAAAYPADPGVVIAALMNRVSLRRGECLFAPAGLLHAYLRGVGIELMTASDNVVRGGLTSKNIDTAELARLVSFDQAPAALCDPHVPLPGVAEYRPDAPFALTVVDVTTEPVTLTLDGPGFLLAEAGPVTLRSPDSGASLVRGEAVFIPITDTTLTLTGQGRVWIATSRAAADS